MEAYPSLHLKVNNAACLLLLVLLSRIDTYRRFFCLHNLHQALITSSHCFALHCKTGINKLNVLYFFCTNYKLTIIKLAMEKKCIMH